MINANHFGVYHKKRGLGSTATVTTYNNLTVLSNTSLRSDTISSPTISNRFYIMANNSVGNYFSFDMGSSKQLKSWSCNNPNQGSGQNWGGGVVQCSNDNVTWTDVDSFALSEGAGQLNHTVSNTTTGRYWRFYQTAACTTGTWHINSLVLKMQ